MIEGDLKASLFDFLRGESQVVTLPGEGRFTREQAEAKLRELIPTRVRVMDRCRLPLAVVAAAPHVRYDGWSEWYCRQAARALGSGRVVARHFRDHNEYDIPTPIGRHIHVNRPTESRRPRGREVRTERAADAYRRYIAAIARAAGGELPVDLLLEFHAHKRHSTIEIATCGIPSELAGELVEQYARQASESGTTIPLRIEPLHKLHFTARQAKRSGSLSGAVARAALHIEIPLALRRDAESRKLGIDLLLPLLHRVVVAGMDRDKDH